jgi:hypothetical protein
MEEAKAQMESESTSDWSDARTKLKKVMDTSKDAALVAEATDLYYESKRQTLVMQAERGVILSLQTPNTQRFVEGVGFQQDGRSEDARQIFESLVAEIAPDGEERHIYLEAKSRLDQLASHPSLPADKEQLHEMIVGSLGAVSKADLEKSQELLSKIILQYSADPTYQTVVQNAENKLEIIKQRLSEVPPEDAGNPVEASADEGAPPDPDEFDKSNLY